jgi:hypothetical protein
LPLNFASRPEAASIRAAAEAAAAAERPAAELGGGGGSGLTADRTAASAPGAPISEPGPPSVPDEEEGPPSAPRLRETQEDEIAAEEREIDEEEPQLKTPPPESGRQHVTPGPSPAVSEPDDDISITVTMEESEVPPSVSEPSAEPMSAPARHEIPEVSGPQPRLALVSEPEIELHGMTPLASVVEPATPVKPIPAADPRLAATSPIRPQDVDLAVPVAAAAPVIPSAAPSGIRPTTAQPPVAPPAPPAPPPAPLSRTAPSAGVADTRPSAGTPASGEPAAPPMRMMTQPLADVSGKPLPPVEVWASTFTPAALRGQVASFVGHNANFEPKTFGELVRATIALGDDKP